MSILKNFLFILAAFLLSLEIIQASNDLPVHNMETEREFLNRVTGRFSNGTEVSFSLHPTLKDSENFFTAMGTTHVEASEKLLQYIKDPEIRMWVGNDIEKIFYAAELPKSMISTQPLISDLKSNLDASIGALHKLAEKISHGLDHEAFKRKLNKTNERVNRDKRIIHDFIFRKSTYRNFVQNYVGNITFKPMLLFHPDTNGQTYYSTMDAIAKALGKGLRIWKSIGTHLREITHYYYPEHMTEVIDIDFSDNRFNLLHRLESLESNHNKTTPEVKTSLQDGDQIINFRRFELAFAQEIDGEHQLANFNYNLAYTKQPKEDLLHNFNVNTEQQLPPENATQANTGEYHLTLTGKSFSQGLGDQVKFSPGHTSAQVEIKKTVVLKGYPQEDHHKGEIELMDMKAARKVYEEKTTGQDKRVHLVEPLRAEFSQEFKGMKNPFVIELERAQGKDLRYYVKESIGRLHEIHDLNDAPICRILPEVAEQLALFHKRLRPSQEEIASWNGQRPAWVHRLKPQDLLHKIQSDDDVNFNWAINQLIHVVNQFQSYSSGRFSLDDFCNLLTITHGDLHVDNMFWDELHSKGYLIDYSTMVKRDERKDKEPFQYRDLCEDIGRLLGSFWMSAIVPVANGEQERDHDVLPDMTQENLERYKRAAALLQICEDIFLAKYVESHFGNKTPTHYREILNKGIAYYKWKYYSVVLSDKNNGNYNDTLAKLQSLHMLNVCGQKAGFEVYDQSVNCGSPANYKMKLELNFHSGKLVLSMHPFYDWSDCKLSSSHVDEIWKSRGLCSELKWHIWPLKSSSQVYLLVPLNLNSPFTWRISLIEHGKKILFQDKK